jgi:single-stranded-DNA-specific exonuclease
VKGINLADAFQAAEAKGLIIKGGGHAMAGGFTAHIDQIENFKIFLNDHFAQQQSQSPTHPTLDIDALLSVQGVRVDLVKMLHEKMSPFGMGNPEPLFMLQRIRIIQPAIVGRDHIRCLITDQEGGRSIKAMSFGSVGTAMGDAILSAKGSMNFDLVGCVKINSWQGNESAEIHIRDVRLNG